MMTINRKLLDIIPKQGFGNEKLYGLWSEKLYDLWNEKLYDLWNEKLYDLWNEKAINQKKTKNVLVNQTTKNVLVPKPLFGNTI